MRRPRTADERAPRNAERSGPLPMHFRRMDEGSDADFTVLARVHEENVCKLPDLVRSWTSRPLQARCAGCDLHAGVTVAGEDRPRLERLCRYLLRPPIAQDRLALRPDGTVLVTLKTPWRDGTTHLRFEPLTLSGEPIRGSLLRRPRLPKRPRRGFDTPVPCRRRRSDDRLRSGYVAIRAFETAISTPRPSTATDGACGTPRRARHGDAHRALPTCLPSSPIPSRWTRRRPWPPTCCRQSRSAYQSTSRGGRGTA